MSIALIRAVAVSLLFFAALAVSWEIPGANAQEKPAVFPVKYLTGDTVYLAAGRNAGIQEGMRLSVVNPPQDGATDNGVRLRGEEHVAELRVISVADSSAVCEIVSTKSELKVGQLAFLTTDSLQERRQDGVFRF